MSIIDAISVQARGFAAPRERLLAGWRQRVRLWRARSRQRRALARLDDRLLADIGVSRAAARHETAKPFWR